MSLEIGDAEDASFAALEGSLHLFCAEEKTVGRHRAGVVAALAPAKAEPEENEDGGPGLEADELGQEAVDSIQFLRTGQRRGDVLRGTPRRRRGEGTRWQIAREVEEGASGHQPSCSACDSSRLRSLRFCLACFCLSSGPGCDAPAVRVPKSGWVRDAFLCRKRRVVPAPTGPVPTTTTATTPKWLR